jgi:hypothetical protein
MFVNAYAGADGGAGRGHHRRHANLAALVPRLVDEFGARLSDEEIRRIADEISTATPRYRSDRS